jgi:hypothetical protein
MLFPEYITNCIRRKEEFVNFKDVRKLLGRRFYYVYKDWYGGKFEYKIDYDVFDNVIVYKDSASIRSRNSDANTWHEGQFFLKREDAENYLKGL